MNTIVKFYEGLKGSGVVVSVRYNQSRVIFDFGAPFRPSAQVYDGIVQKRDANWVTDAIDLGQVPAVEGLFAKKDITSLGLQAAEESSLTTAVLISHLHLDHMSQIGMVHPDIPVYLHKHAYELELALRTVGEDVGTRSYQFHEYHQPFMVGELKITSYFSDHPCYGACSYLIESPDQTIFYSGDIRYHGLQAERAFKEIESLNKKIDLLIIDGTTYSPEKFAFDSNYQEISNPSKGIVGDMISEEDIYTDVSNKLADSKTLAMFNIYHRDMQLIQALLKIANDNNRQLMFEPETAYIYSALFTEQINYYVPDYKSYSEVDSILTKLPNHTKEIKVAEIKANPEQYFIQNSYAHLMQCNEFKTDQKNSYFHLFGEPFTSNDWAYKSFTNCLELFRCNLHAYANLYSFNHAYPNHLSYVIHTLQPTTIVAVHSNHPEKLNSMNSIQFFPEQFKEYFLVDGILKEFNK